MRALAILATLALAGCATAPANGPPPAAVPVSCVAKDFPAAPVYTDTREALKAAPNGAVRYRLLAGNWWLRDARLAVLEQQVDACR